MKKTFKCNCGTHLLEIEYNNIIKWVDTKTKKKHKENMPELWVGIYDIYNPDTGRKYRKPKLLGDVCFMLGTPYIKEMDFLMKFLDDILTKWYCRKK